MIITAPAYTITWAAARKSAWSSRYMVASETRFMISDSAEWNGLPDSTTPSAEITASAAATAKAMS